MRQRRQSSLWDEHLKATRLQLGPELFHVWRTVHDDAAVRDSCVELILKARGAIKHSFEHTLLQGMLNTAQDRFTSEEPPRRSSRPTYFGQRKPEKANSSLPSSKGSKAPEGFLLPDESKSSRASTSVSGHEEVIQWRWSTVQDLVLYGTGSIFSYRKEVVDGIRQDKDSKRVGMRLQQLALALVLAEALPGLVQKPQCFDPEYLEEDKEVLRALGFDITAGNENASRTVSKPTLFYMPCLPRHLYSNLVSANWGMTGLPNIAILGTSFKSLQASSLLVSSLSDQEPITEPAAWLSARGGVLELMCPDCAAHGIATSLHLFPPRLLSKTNLVDHQSPGAVSSHLQGAE